MSIIAKARAMHRGALGLGVTFWLWFILPLWLVRAVVYLALLSLTIAPGDSVAAIEAAAITTLWLAANTAWLIYAGIGVWRSAGRSPGFWGIAARVLIFLNIALLVVNILGSGVELIDHGLRALWPVAYR